jgi:hypothetical protein
MESMNRRIVISSNAIPADELKKLLEFRSLCECTLTVELVLQRFRGAEVGVLVALVGLAGTGLGALITGLLNVAAQRQIAFIEVKGSDWGVRVPATTEGEELRRLIEIARSKEVNCIVMGDELTQSDRNRR